MARVLITGGTGFLGRATVELLLHEGWTVRVLTRGAWPFHEHPQLGRCDGDMTDAASLARAVENCDSVLHLAARKHDETDSVAVNVEGTKTLCDAARAAGVSRIVYVSTQSAALRRRGIYGETKLQAEHVVQASGVPWTILRPSVVYGDSNDGIIGTIARMGTLPFIPVFGSGRAIFWPIHIDDMAQAIVQSIASDRVIGRTLDIGGPDGVSFDDLIKRILHAAGRRARILHVPVWIGLLGAALLRLLPNPPITRSNVLGGAQTLHMDPRSAHALLGISPTPFREKFPRLPGDDDRCIARAARLIRYVSHNTVYPTPALTARLRQAHEMHAIPEYPLPLFLSAIDAAAAMWFPHGTLRQSMLLAAAIVECAPESADIFLPRERSAGIVILRTIGLGLWSVCLIVIGTILFVIPPFRRYAE